MSSTHPREQESSLDLVDGLTGYRLATNLLAER